VFARFSTDHHDESFDGMKKRLSVSYFVTGVLRLLRVLSQQTIRI
jgi:hypothetical protein